MYEDEQQKHIKERTLQYYNFSFPSLNRREREKNVLTKMLIYFKKNLFTGNNFSTFNFKEISLTRMGIIFLLIFLIGIVLLSIGLIRLIK